MNPEERQELEKKATGWFLSWIALLADEKLEELPTPHEIVLQQNGEYTSPFPEVVVRLLVPNPHWMMVFNSEGWLRGFHNYSIDVDFEIPVRKYATMDISVLLEKAATIKLGIKTHLDFQLVSWEMNTHSGVTKFDPELGHDSPHGTPMFTVNYKAKVNGCTVGDAQLVMSFEGHTGRLRGLRVDDFEVPPFELPQMTPDVATALAEEYIRRTNAQWRGDSPHGTRIIHEIAPLNQSLRLGTPIEIMKVNVNKLVLMYRCGFEVTYEDSDRAGLQKLREVVDISCDTQKGTCILLFPPHRFGDKIPEYIW